MTEVSSTKSIGDVEKAPHWMIGNKFIKSGYRLNHTTLADTTLSMFRRHNETFNIWSHLLPALFFVYVAFYIHTYMAAPEII